MKKNIFILLFCLSLLMPIVLKADGGLIPPDNYYIWETQQRGVIFYESESQTETLVLSMSFQGNAKDFAWIVPTPNKPDVQQGTQDIFTNLNEITDSYYYYPYPSTLGLGESAVRDEGVAVVEQKTVDYYDVSVLSATDASALTKWLNDNGYKYPEKYSYIFNEYIKNGWYFVAAKIVPAMADDTTVTTDLSTGTATPLALTFTAENITFPLKISQISSAAQVTPTADDIYYSDYYSNPYTSIYLYVIADHKQELANFTTEYADTIKKKEIEELAADTNGNAWVAPAQNKYWLTELYVGYYTAADMKSDLFPKAAAKDTKVKSGYEWDRGETIKMILYAVLFSVIGLILVLLTPCFLLFFIFSLVYYLTRRSTVRAVMLVFQIIDTVVTGLMLGACIALTVLAFVSLFSGSGYYYQMSEQIALTSCAIASVVVFAVLLAVKIVAMVVQKKKAKKIK